MKIIFQTIIFRFYVNLPVCTKKNGFFREKKKDNCTNKIFNIATPFPLKLKKKNELTPNPHFKALPFLKGIKETEPPNPKKST